MAKDRKNKLPSLSEMTPEQIGQLDKNTLVGMLMRVLEQNRQLSEILQQMVREKHGPKTEHFENPDQLRVFGADSGQPTTDVIDGPAPGRSASAQSGSAQKKNRKRPRHNPMPANLEHKRITGSADAGLKCKHCSHALEKVNEVLRNSRFEYQPASVFIEDFVAMIFKCCGCGRTQTIEPPIVNDYMLKAGPALQTEIAVAKFEDHLPLHRQEQRFARLGAPIARSTMVGWLTSMSNTLRPIYDRMHALLMLSKVIATDDTPVKVLDRKSRRALRKKLKIKIGRIWIYRGDEQHPFNVFNYTEGRGREGPLAFIPKFKGYLQGDCFSGNLALCAATGATFAACLVHARRYFIKAVPNNKGACDEILSMFSDIFEIEQTARDLGLGANEIELMREQESKPILETMKKWLDDKALTALPKSMFGKGIHYCLNNWTELTNFLLDGDVRADNNLAEQEMKRIACGRKNWLFLGSDEGGKMAEVLLSLISTCRRHNVNPTEYLQDVLTILTQNPHSELDPLLPHNWKHLRGKSEIATCHTTPKTVCA